MIIEAGKRWMADSAPRMGAALAFYTALSLSPLLIISFSLISLVYGDDAARGLLQYQLRDLLGKDGAEVAQGILASSRDETTGIIAMVVGFFTLFLGASGVFGELQDALNIVWDVKAKPGRAVVEIIRTRFLSFAMVLGTGFLLLVSLLMSAAVAAIGTYATGVLPQFAPLMEILNSSVSFAVVTLMFALIFKVLPDAHIAWTDVWFGALITAALFTIGKIAIGIYIGHAGVGSGFGAAGSLIALLVWVYYAAQILLFGAELTRVAAVERGHVSTVPKACAEKRPIAQEKLVVASKALGSE